MKLLLKPGWAGELTPNELADIKTCLKSSPMLRRRWGFRTTRISDAMIQKAATEGVGDPQKSAEAHHNPAETYLRQKRKGAR